MIAGLKLMVYQGNKWIKITKHFVSYAIQLGEYIVFDLNNPEIYTIIKKTVKTLINELNVNKFQAKGIYGGVDKIINFSEYKSNKINEFYSAYVDIDKEEQSLLATFNRNTRRNIKKAIENECKMKEIEMEEIDSFLNLEKKVYEKQIAVKPPNTDFIKLLAKLGKQQNNEHIKIHLSTINNQIGAGSFFTVFNNVAYSNFGGSIANNGEGHYIYFELMKLFKEKGVTKFYFGQMNKSGNNEKFEKISTFKEGFSPVKIDSISTSIIFNPIKNNMGLILLKLLNKNQ